MVWGDLVPGALGCGELCTFRLFRSALLLLLGDGEWAPWGCFDRNGTYVAWLKRCLLCLTLHGTDVSKIRREAAMPLSLAMKVLKPCLHP